MIYRSRTAAKVDEAESRSFDDEVGPPLRDGGDVPSVGERARIRSRGTPVLAVRHDGDGPPDGAAALRGRAVPAAPPRPRLLRKPP